MKHLLSAAAAVALVSASPAAALGGMAVFDQQALVKQIEQIRNTMQMIEQGRRQIEQAQRLYDDLNGLTDVPRIADRLKNDALRTLDVDADSLSRMARGDFRSPGHYGPSADRAYRDLMDALGDGGIDPSETAYRDRYSERARNIAFEKALADGVGDSVSSRGAGLDELRDRLSTAETAKEVAALNARLQLETAAIANDEMRLMAIDRAREAALQERAAKERAASFRHIQDARNFYKENAR